MPLALTRDYPRLWSINSGIAMIVTDLHGDWKTYQLYRDQFVNLYSEGRLNWLIFTGDLIHSESKDFDDLSIEIVLDILNLKSKFSDAIVYLCGNHELPHLYGYGLAKGSVEYTPSFELQMSKSKARKEIIELLLDNPFYIRTTAGVSITHAGASPVISDQQSALSLFNWNHRSILTKAQSKLLKGDKEGMRRAYAKLSQKESYEELATRYLSVTGKDDPRYDDLLLGFFATSDDEFDLLYSALSTSCEQELDIDKYSVALTKLLQYLSSGYSNQNFLVSGHMTVQEGYQIVTKNQLRIASGVHAKPVQTGRYLLFDTAKPIENIESLLEGLKSIF